MAASQEDLRELVTANRILANEGVVDAYGHVSMRDPENPDRYLIARSRAPELITAEDIIARSVGRELRAMGHRVQMISLRGEMRMGYGAAVVIGNNEVTAGADPRRSGAAKAARK